MSSIQFGCQGCGQRLKVPDGSAGKQVRCPECETVNVIPSSGEEEAASPYAEPPIDPGSQQNENPFAAPNAGYDQQSVSIGTLTHQSIEFGDVFEQAWERYKIQLGAAALFGVIFIGIGFASGILGQVVQLAAAATESAAVVVIAMIIVTVAQQVVSAFQQLIGKRFGLNVVRGSTEPLTGIFSFNRVLRVIGFFLLVGIAMAVGVGIVVIPGAACAAIDPKGNGIAMVGIGISVVLGIALAITFFIMMLRLFLTMFFIVDRDATIREACEQSMKYMHGNKLQAFLVSFVAGLLVGLVTILTCGLGIVVAYPFGEVIQAMIYSKATGQYQNLGQRTA